MDTGAALDNVYAFEEIEDEFETQSDTDTGQEEHSFGDLPENMCEIVIKAEPEDEKDEHIIEQTFVSSQTVCDICQKLFATKDGLKQHIRVVHLNEKNFCCEICTKKFGTIYKLTWHIRDVHEKSGDFACGFCGKRFFREFDRMLHERMHTGEKPFQCDDCGRAFHRKEVLKRHRHSVHSGIKYPCHMCKYEAKEKGHLRRHLKTVHKNTVLDLMQASQSVDFKDADDSKKDIKKKNDETIKEEDLKANVDKIKSNVVHNEMHPEVTLDGEQLRTTESGSKYGVKEETEAMNNIECKTELAPEQIHTDERPCPENEKKFCCEVCSKMFASRRNMVNHVNAVHEKNRKYSCELCDKCFLHKASLSKHFQATHLGIRYPCQICSYEAKEKGHLLKHQKSVHKNTST